MHWIIQEDIHQEGAFERLLTAIDQAGSTYSIHKVVPFVGELIPRPTATGKIICIGAYSMRLIAAREGWNPGVFDIMDTALNDLWLCWGDRLLNHDAEVIKFRDIPTDRGLLFIRPDSDSKTFAGRVFDGPELEKWKTGVVKLGEDDGSTLTGDTMVVVCAPKQIFVEVRCFVVAKRVVTASIYKRGDRVTYSDQVDQAYIDFAQHMVDLWTTAPVDSYVIDVADTPEGFKVVEVNTLNASGFYACDMQRLVGALEDEYDPD